MVFLGAVFGVLEAVESGVVAEVSAAFEPLAVGGGKWLLDPTTQPTTARMMTTGLIPTIRNFFMVLPHVLGTHSARKLANALNHEFKGLLLLDTGWETAVSEFGGLAGVLNFG